MDKRTYEMLNRLVQLGINENDAQALRRISMTLHRWHELECGDGNDYASWTVVRGKYEAGVFTYDDGGMPYIEYHNHKENSPRYLHTPDRERGAQKRLAKIMKQYPALSAYVQDDPRGAALYILPPGVDTENYNRGIAVHK